MDETRLRAWTEQKLKRGQIPDDVWQNLSDDINDACNHWDSPENRPPFLKAVRARWDLYNRALRKAEREFDRTERKPRQRKPTPDQLRHLNYVLRRTHALSRHLAFVASAHPRVRQFRQGLFRELLDDSAAVALFTSPAAQRLSRREFAEAGRSITSHQATLNHQRVQGGARPGSIRLLAEVSFPDPAGVCTAACSLSGSESLPHLRCYDASLGIVDIPVFPGSVLDEVRLECEWLVAQYGWEHGAAARFLLTGAMPWCYPIKIALESYYRPDWTENVITLKVSPWIPAAVVAQSFHDAQRRLLNAENRPLNDRQLDLVAFVAGHIDERGHMPKWATVLKAWNQAIGDKQPNWRYPTAGRLAADYWRTADDLLFPTYQLRYALPEHKQTVLALSAAHRARANRREVTPFDIREQRPLLAHLLQRYPEGHSLHDATAKALAALCGYPTPGSADADPAEEALGQEILEEAVSKRLRQLVDNAARAMFGSGEINFRVRRSPLTDKELRAELAPDDEVDDSDYCGDEPHLRADIKSADDRLP